MGRHKGGGWRKNREKITERREKRRETERRLADRLVLRDSRRKKTQG
jgi:hypothetical protein